VGRVSGAGLVAFIVAVFMNEFAPQFPANAVVNTREQVH